MKPVILVIDDDFRVKQSLELAFPSYTFIGASSGKEGLEQLERPNEIDLVLLDLKMAEQDGIAVLQQIKRLDPEIRVIILTGYGSKDMVVQALQGRADDFIDKPYRVGEVRERFEKFLRVKSGREQPYGRKKDPIRRIMNLIEKNYRKPLTLQDAAGVASLSPKYLSRKFKQETRRNFTEFRITLRMDEARKLLAGTSFNLTQIADRIGYENAESFIKMFKKKSGCTPTEYRLQKS